MRVGDSTTHRLRLLVPAVVLCAESFVISPVVPLRRRRLMAQRDEVPLLPPQSAEMVGRPTLCLDLDETLIMTPQATPRWEPVLAKDLAFFESYGTPVAALEITFDWRPNSWKPNEVVRTTQTIFTRPYLREFFESVSRSWEVVLWTASVPERAAAVLAVIDPGGQFFQHSLARDAGGGTKDASLLGRDPKRCVLLDDLWYKVEAFKGGGGSGIVVPWYLGREAYDVSGDQIPRYLEDRAPGGRRGDLDDELERQYGDKRIFLESDLTFLPNALYLKRLEPGLTQLATSDDIHGDLGGGSCSMSFAGLDS